jgi:hypothetical protein
VTTKIPSGLYLNLAPRERAVAYLAAVARCDAAEADRLNESARWQPCRVADHSNEVQALTTLSLTLQRQQMELAANYWRMATGACCPLISFESLNDLLGDVPEGPDDRAGGGPGDGPDDCTDHDPDGLGRIRIAGWYHAVADVFAFIYAVRAQAWERFCSECGASSADLEGAPSDYFKEMVESAMTHAASTPDNLERLRRWRSKTCLGNCLPWRPSLRTCAALIARYSDRRPAPRPDRRRVAARSWIPVAKCPVQGHPEEISLN